MKVLAYVEAAVSLSAPIAMWRPENGLPVPDMLAGVSSRYNFQAAGLGEATGMPSYQTGEFVYDGSAISIQALEFQPNGVIALSTKTENIELFLNDLCRYLETDLQFRQDVEFKKQYRTSLISEHSFDIDVAFYSFQSIQACLDRLLQKQSPGANVKPMGIRFQVFDGDRQTDRNITIERRIGQEAAPGRLFSSSPLPTADHLELIRKFDEVYRS